MSDQNIHDSTIVIALAADMIFGAKIRGTAQAVGVPIQLARNPAHLIELARPLTGTASGGAARRLIIVDLDTRGLDIAGTIAALKGEPGNVVLAYVSHVNTAAIRAARDAGADRVLARSAFTTGLAEILKGGPGQQTGSP